MRSTASAPTVTVAIPVLDEEGYLDACLAAVEAQTYPGAIEVLVVDGGSADRTREVALGHDGVVVLDNPLRIQAAALNIALEAARGDVFVRVDGHCRIADDHVEQAVDALERTGASMVGGAMQPVAVGPVRAGIAAAMRSRFGIGPARFHRNGPAGWVDTVYLGAFRTGTAREVGGYDERMVANEDAEFAQRMRPRGGIWFDPTIRSTYTPRSSLRALAVQFHRYGRYRARTVLRHPASLRPRQLAPVALVLGLALLPGRRRLLAAYAAMVATATVIDGTGGPAERAAYAAALPAMHLPWGAGFLAGLTSARPHVLRRR